MKKVFSDLTKQINILKSKNLTIENETKALEILAKFNYYVVINGYRKPFIKNNNNSEKSSYIDGVTFEEIYSFYMFDRGIRIIFLKYILIVEQNFKSAISYEFSKKYGFEDYLKFENFDCDNPKNIREIFYLIGTLHNSLSKSIGKNEYITYNIEKYNNVPFWILSNVITLGSIINFYKLMKDDEKKYISKKYFRMKSEELEDCMEIINFYRNICAHDERLYDCKTRVSLPKNEFYKYFHLNEHDSDEKNVFSLLVALCLMLTKDDEKNLIDELIFEFEKLKKNLKSIKIQEIYKIMGFQNNWKDIKNLNF